MRTAGKIFKIILLLIFIVSAIMISASFVLQDKIAEIVIGKINRDISTKINVGSFNLSFIRSFPRASLELKNVSVLSSPGFRKEAFKGINTDTLLVASSISVDFKLTDIIRKIYDIDRIGISKGRISLYTDSAGLVNYDITMAKTDSDNSSLSLNLQRILLSETMFSYNNLATKLLIVGIFKDGKISSRISGNNINLSAEADLLITGIQQNNIKIDRPFKAGLELKLEENEDLILFRKGIFTVEGFRFGISGSVSANNNMDLEFEGENIDLAKIRKYLPKDYLKLISDYDLSGNIQLKSHVTGRFSKTSNPHIDLTSTLINGGITCSETGMIIKKMSFVGSLSNGIRNNSETSSVSIRDFKADIGSANYSGNMVIRNFNSPKTELDFNGRIFPGELKQFFRLNTISSASGFFDLNMRLKTDYWPKDSITFKDIATLKPEASVKFYSLNIALGDSKQELSNINGSLLLSGSMIAKNLQFVYRHQKIAVDGEFVNLPEWIIDSRVNLKADADIYFDKLIPETLFGKRQVPDDKSIKEKVFSMPDDLLLNIRLKIDSLEDETIPSTNINVNLSYQPGILTFKALNMKSLNGTISGNGFIAQDRTKSIMSKGSFNLTDIDIKKAFLTFRNFGQNFIKAENLAGNLTGTLTILLPIDSLLKPQIKSLVAEGRYIITDGSLIDFEPVKELSAFIELNELENIKFEKLENDFFIRNNFLYIPQMEVNSSAADLSVNGKHSFDNSFEYHVKILLSELLSKKRKKIRSNNSEFGAVQDDGLGRTSILLRIESKGNDIKVGYDIKAVGDKVKASIKSEKQTLKTILNQEYGLFKSDSISQSKPTEKKPRFRISWDEPDSLKKEPDPASVKKENALKSLLKKK
jgi:hypothetical protein